MFLLYGIAVGLAAGLASGGHLAGLAQARFHWAPLAVAGLGAQLVILNPVTAGHVGALGPFLYVGSSVLVLLVVIRNARLPGLRIVALGAALNLAAILANGGYMPTRAATLSAAGQSLPNAYTNSTVLDGAALALLTDIFAMPAWMPLASVFSIGDVLIGLGVIVAIVAAMRTRPITAAA